MVTDIITEHETWLNENREMTDKEMIEQKTKEFQDTISGVMSKLYQGMPGGKVCLVVCLVCLKMSHLNSDQPLMK